MNESKKFLQKHERKKRQEKSEKYYVKLLDNFEEKTLKKMQKTLDVLNEELNLLNTSDQEPPYLVEIRHIKFEKAGLLVDDAGKILTLLRSDSYMALPPEPSAEQLPELTGSVFYIFAPINGWSTPIQDYAFEYPFQQNYKNLEGALRERLSEYELLQAIDRVSFPVGQQPRPAQKHNNTFFDTIQDKIQEEKDRDRQEKQHRENINMLRHIASSKENKDQHSKQQSKTGAPRLKEHNGVGFLKLGEKGEEIKISKLNTQQYKLLQSLMEPHLGVCKSVNSVFEAINDNVQEGNKTGVYTRAPDRKLKQQIIKRVIKDLQKGKRMRRANLTFKWDEQETQLWIEYNP